MEAVSCSILLKSLVILSANVWFLQYQWDVYDGHINEDCPCDTVFLIVKTESLKYLNIPRFIFQLALRDALLKKKKHLLK